MKDLERNFWSEEARQALEELELRFKERQGEEGTDDELPDDATPADIYKAARDASKAVKESSPADSSKPKPQQTKSPKRKKAVPDTPRVKAARERLSEVKAEIEATKRSVPIKEAAGPGKQSSIAFLRAGGLTSDEMNRVTNYLHTFSPDRLAKFNQAAAKAQSESELELLYKKTLLLALQKGF